MYLAHFVKVKMPTIVGILICIVKMPTIVGILICISRINYRFGD